MKAMKTFDEMIKFSRTYINKQDVKNDGKRMFINDGSIKPKR